MLAVEDNDFDILVKFDVFEVVNAAEDVTGLPVVNVELAPLIGAAEGLTTGATIGLDESAGDSPCGGCTLPAVPPYGLLGGRGFAGYVSAGFEGGVGAAVATAVFCCGEPASVATAVPAGTTAVTPLIPPQKVVVPISDVS